MTGPGYHIWDKLPSSQAWDAWEAVLSEHLGPAQSLPSGFKGTGRQGEGSREQFQSEQRITGSFDHFSPDGLPPG